MTPSIEDALRSGAWRLVPVEATGAMLQAVITANRAETGLLIPIAFECAAGQMAYKAMLTASPSPAASPASPSGDVVAHIAEFLKERDESVLPDEVDDAERAASAEEILRRASLASDATPAPTSGSEDASPYDDAVQGDKMLMELLNAAVDENIRLRAALAKPASEPAGGDAAINAAVEAMEDDLFIDDIPLQGTSQNSARLRHYATIAVKAAALSSSAGPAVEAVAWRAVAHPETGMGTLVNQIKWMLVERADSLYGPGKWDLQELGPIPAHPAPATVEMREADIARWKRDSELLSAIQDEYWDVRFTSTPNADAGDYNVNIEIVSHFMAEPQERVVGENYNENLRAALEQAMTADAYPPARPVYDLPAALAPATEGRKS